jgi:hypothetical protein
MASIALHIKTTQPLADAFGRAIACALRPVSQEIQAALERAQPELAWRLASTSLAQATASLTTNDSSRTDLRLHLLAVDIALGPLTCLADGTLQEALEVWVEHRAWRVNPADGLRLARLAGQRWGAAADVTWNQRVTPQGHWEASAWTVLA